MTMTLQEATDTTREVMNAVGSGQWSDLILRRWVGVAHHAEYADLLNANRFYTSQQVIVAQDANGQVPVVNLSTGYGDSAQRFYRMLSVSQNAGNTATVQFFYRQSSYEQFPNPQPNTSLPYVWYRMGDNIQILPVASGQQIVFTTNWRPTRADKLASPQSTITFPDDYEDLIPWRAAAMALAKGGSEVDAAKSVLDVYQPLHDSMMLDLGREGTWPIVARAFDQAEDWGS